MPPEDSRVPPALLALGGRLRGPLDRLYNGCGAVAGVALLLILGIMLAQMLARWTGTQFPGSTSYAGYAMATASFFAFAYTLNHGGHIRVSLFIQRFAGTKRRIAELWAFGVAMLLSIYFAWFAVKAIRVSYVLNDVSQGQDATPLWLPQLAMGIGTVVLAIALIDRFIRVLFGGPYELGQGSAAIRIE